VSFENHIDIAWDLILPLIQPSSNLLPSSGFGSRLSIRDLVGATQYGTTAETPHNYLINFRNKPYPGVINDDVERFPTMFYAVCD
jgi:hypothetical protein